RLRHPSVLRDSVPVLRARVRRCRASDCQHRHESATAIMSVTSRFAALRQIWQFDNRWHLLFNRLLFRRETVALYRLGDLRVLVDHAAGDPSGAPEVLTHAMYVDHLPHLLRDHP